MIQFFRRIFSSKLGTVGALLFLGLIVFAFASSDIAGVGNFSGGATGGKVAEVGSKDINAADVRDRLMRAYDQARLENPALDQTTFMNSGAFDQLLNELIDTYTLEQYAREIGFGVSKRLVDARIAEIPGFAGLDGKFSQSIFEQALRQNGIKEKDLRDDIERQLLVEQMLAPISAPLRISADFSAPYASLMLEERYGQATFIPSANYAPTNAPSDAELTKFIQSKRAQYLVPEQRVVRYALFDAHSVTTAPTVTDAEISKFYDDNKATFAGTETRRFGQVIASSEDQAKKIAAAAQSSTINAASSAAGLEASEISAQKPEDIASATSQDVAKQAFAVAENGVVGPVKVPLGWAVLKLNKIDRVAAKTLADARPEIETALIERKKFEAAQDFFNTIQEQIDSGASVEEVAKSKNLTLVSTPAILPNGQSIQDTSFKPAPELAALIGPAFQGARAGEAQLITVKENEQFAVVDTGKIIAAAVPPLAEIKERATADWKSSVGATKARDLARKINDRVNKGASLDAAVKAEGAKTAPIQRIGGKRLDVAQAQGKVPSEVALLFSMDPNSSKTLEMPNNAGWMVLHLNESKRGDAKNQPELVTAIQQQMSRSLGNDYAGQLLAAARKAVGVRRNEDAIAALKKELTSSGAAQQQQ